MSTNERNPVARAIGILGGMTRSVVASGYSESTWHRWRREGCVADPRACFAISDLTGISARELAGCEVDGPRDDDAAPVPNAAPISAMAQARRNARETAATTAQTRGTVRGSAKRGRGMPSRCTHAATGRVATLTPAAEAA